MLGDTSCTSELRQLIAQCVAGDPETYNLAFLGRANKEYCDWIVNKNNWGGKHDSKSVQPIYVHIYVEYFASLLLKRRRIIGKKFRTLSRF